MYGHKIKAKMEREGKTVYRVAQDMGVRWSTVKNWIEGTHSPKGAYERLLREYLGEKS